jgi:hypothetical protein
MLFYVRCNDAPWSEIPAIKGLEYKLLLRSTEAKIYNDGGISRDKKDLREELVVNSIGFLGILKRKPCAVSYKQSL